MQKYTYIHDYMISKPTKHINEHNRVETTHSNSLSPSRPIKLLFYSTLWSLLLLPPMWPQFQTGRREGGGLLCVWWGCWWCFSDHQVAVEQTAAGWLAGRSRETRTEEDIRDRPRRAPCSPVPIMDLIRSCNFELVARAAIIILAFVHGELRFCSNFVATFVLSVKCDVTWVLPQLLLNQYLLFEFVQIHLFITCVCVCARVRACFLLY